MREQPTESLLLSPQAQAPSQGRRFIKATLARWDLEVLTDTAVLLTSELVTNAILYAQTEIAVTIRREDCACVSISVQDESTALPHLTAHAEDATTGRGIEILDQLATSWTVIAHETGKTVSFILRASLFPNSPAA
jgi:anti-sigma regulatory factor (Ser/Thr protein kinase)